MENNGLEPLTPCVQSRCSKPTELIPPSRGLAHCPLRISCYLTILLRLQKLAGGKAPPPLSTPPPLFPIGAPLSCRFGPVHSPVRYCPLRSIARGAVQKGGVPAAPSGTATLLRLSPSHPYCPWPRLAVADFRHPGLPWLDGRCVQGPGTYSPLYKARERIHRAMADARLLANPASWSRVADSNPNWDGVWGSAIARTTASRCAPPL